MRSRFKVLTLLLGVALLAVACGDSEDTASKSKEGGSLVIYSGRSEELVGSLVKQFEEATGISVEIRYGDTAEMAAQILEEGENSPADVFFGQDAGALGALAAEGRLVELPKEQLDKVPAGLKDPEGRWVGASARARVVVYNTAKLTEGDLPDSVLDFTNPAWSGRIGWAPTNGSFQAFVTGLRVLKGEDGARSWLQGIQANKPAVFDKNSAIVEAVGAGEIDVGFVNHYYAYQLRKTNPDLAVANKFFGGGDPGGLVNVAAGGILDTAANPAAAERFIGFLLSNQAQRYFAEKTFEIPVVDGVKPVETVPTLDDLVLPEIDLNQLGDLEGTLALLTDLGIV